MFLLFALSVTVLILHFLYNFKYGERNAAFAKFPTPKKKDLFRNSINTKTWTLTGIFQKIEQWHDDLGDIFLLTTHPFDCGTIFVSDPEVAEALSLHQPDRSRAISYKSLGRWIGHDGYFLSGGEQLKSRSKPIRHFFNPKFHEKYLRIVNSHTTEAFKKYQQPGAKEETDDVFHFCKSFSLDTAFDIILGYKFNAKNGDNLKYLKTLEKFFKISMLATFDPRSRSDFLHPFTKLYKAEKRALETLNGFALNIIKERRRATVSNVVNEAEDRIVDHYLKTPIDGKFLTDEEILTEVNTFILGLHDTTQATGGFVIYILAKHPEVQQKMYDEICSIVNNDRERFITERELGLMVYTDAIIKETLRIYPIVPFVGRKLSSDITIGEYTYPKDAEILISPYLMSRSPKNFKNPLEFDPDRFYGQEALPLAFSAFGIGAKKCLGIKMAMKSLKLTLAKLIMNYRLYLPDDIGELTIMSEMILKFEEKVNIKAERRQVKEV